MAAGLVVYDVLFVLLATVLYGGALAAAARVHGALVGVGLPWELAVFPAAFAGIAALVVEVSIGSALCPKLVPGRYPMMKGAMFFGWVARSLLRRILFLPGLRWILFSSNVLRFLALRGLGARIAFSTNMSADVEILDPSLLDAGAGATIGARSLLSGHYVEGGELVLGTVRIGARSLVAAEVMCGPGVVIGERVVVKSRASVSIGVAIGDDAVIGGESLLDAFATIGKGARTETRAHVKPRTVVADGAVVPA